LAVKPAVITRTPAASIRATSARPFAEVRSPEMRSSGFFAARMRSATP
jgi:hypothetical protein